MLKRSSACSYDFWKVIPFFIIIKGAKVSVVHRQLFGIFVDTILLMVQKSG